MYCPTCKRHSELWTAMRVIWVDGVRRAYRRHRKCGTAVCLAGTLAAV